MTDFLDIFDAGFGSVQNAFQNTDGRLVEGAISQTSLDRVMRFDARGRFDLLGSDEAPAELAEALSQDARDELAEALLALGDYDNLEEGETRYPGGELENQADGTLQGIVLVPSADQVRTGSLLRVNGVEDRGVGIPAFEKLQEKLAGYLKQEFDFATINQIIADTIMHYRDNDRPVVDVYAPEQDITYGVLQLVVVEARLGKVIVDGNEHFDTDFLVSQIRLKPGNTVSNRELMQDLDWINRNPFRSVNLIYSRGEAFGTSDIILEVEEVDPIRLFAGYENTGTEVQGVDRVFAGVSLGDAFGWDDQFNYQATYDVDFNSLASHAASYTATLPWRHAMTLVAAYSDSDVDIASASSPFGLSGNGTIAGVRYAVPLPRIRKSPPRRNLFFRLQRHRRHHEVCRDQSV